jgi:hypothetical protein
MLNQKMEQVERFFDLQFFAEEGSGEPGAGSGTPPATGEGNQGNQSAGTVNQGQAVTPPDGGQNQPANQNQGQTVEQQLQAAIKGMNEAQRKAAELEKVLNGVAPEQVAQALQFVQQVQENPQGMIINYIRQNPQAMSEIVKEFGPMQAAQMFNQAFGGQQSQADPYAKYEGIDNMPDLVRAIEADLLAKIDGRIEGKINPVVQPLQQNYQAQYEAGIKTRENARIPENLRDTVWNKVKEIGIPFTQIEKYPWLIDGLIIEAAGGREKYEESIRAAATTTTVKKITDKVIQNNNVAQLTPAGGVNAVQNNGPITDPDARHKEALRRLALLQEIGGS